MIFIGQHRLGQEHPSHTTWKNPDAVLSVQILPAPVPKKTVRRFRRCGFTIRRHHSRSRRRDDNT
jgi:hypothetical protein